MSLQRFEDILVGLLVGVTLGLLLGLGGVVTATEARLKREMTVQNDRIINVILNKRSGESNFNFDIKSESVKVVSPEGIVWGGEAKK